MERYYRIDRVGCLADCHEFTLNRSAVAGEFDPLLYACDNAGLQLPNGIEIHSRPLAPHCKGDRLSRCNLRFPKSGRELGINPVQLGAPCSGSLAALAIPAACWLSGQNDRSRSICSSASQNKSLIKVFLA